MIELVMLGVCLSFVTDSWLTAIWWDAAGLSYLRENTAYARQLAVLEKPHRRAEGHTVRLRLTLHGMNWSHILVKESG